MAANARRATSPEIGEWIASAALHDAREWTRLEMALIELVFEDYPQDVTVGSAFADLGAARQRAARLMNPQLPPADEGPRMRMTPLYQAGSKLRDAEADAVQPGESEDMGEPGA